MQQYLRRLDHSLALIYRHPGLRCVCTSVDAKLKMSNRLRLRWSRDNRTPENLKMATDDVVSTAATSNKETRDSDVRTRYKKDMDWILHI